MAQVVDCVLVTKAIGTARVAEVAREHRFHPPKSLDSDENFKPEHTLSYRELRFVVFYALYKASFLYACI